MTAEAPARATTPGDAALTRLLTSVDQAGDAALDPLRGRPWADTGAAILSNLSDYGYVWVALALWKARRPGPARRRAVLALGGAGVTSYSVNKVAKRLVGRSRPTGAGPGPAAGVGGEGDAGGGAGVVGGSARSAQRLAVRTPTSSSFPSGHTLAAFCTAIVLTEGPAETAGALGLAGAVAASRVHLRAHHPSDVVGGALLGMATGVVVRRALRRQLGPGGGAPA